jgi:hypothetical protein
LLQGSPTPELNVDDREIDSAADSWSRQTPAPPPQAFDRRRRPRETATPLQVSAPDLREKDHSKIQIT